MGSSGRRPDNRSTSGTLALSKVFLGSSGRRLDNRSTSGTLALSNLACQYEERSILYWGRESLKPILFVVIAPDGASLWLVPLIKRLPAAKLRLEVAK
ncbi:MAG: hypothetical protein EAZ26_00295 [Runella slithyformis]|nr:MAG: hypothetical protein EAY79_00500 [Runella slithyformis]TAG75565.1 MAG: hypothetical protein EAZ26_00295 [Runella slithyformis]